MMKAILHTKYGSYDVLKYGEVEKPTPLDDEALVKVHAAAINSGNMFPVSGKPFLSRFGYGLLRPKYLNPGSDVAGRVEAVGVNVTLFKPGDEALEHALRAGFAFQRPDDDDGCQCWPSPTLFTPPR